MFIATSNSSDAPITINNTLQEFYLDLLIVLIVIMCKYLANKHEILQEFFIIKENTVFSKVVLE